MQIFIDADACPVTDIAVSVAKKLNVPCTLLCDTAHVICRGGVKTLTVSKGADSVDFKLVNMITAGDVAVTQDYGLAAMCLAKGAHVIHQDGLLYTADNIDGLLFKRYAGKKARQSGIRLKGPRKRTHEQDIAFEKAFTKLLESLI